MGIKGFGKKLNADNQEIDSDRLCEVKRMRIKPRSGIPAVEIVINDGTGEATVIFSGRRNIPGIEHGKCLMVDGVPHRDGNRTVILNPAYSLLTI